MAWFDELLMSTSSGVAIPDPREKPLWIKMAFTNAAIRAIDDANHGTITLGGAGSQYPRSLMRDADDGNFVLAGIDCGGVWRSLDGGRTWRLASVGYKPNGACAVGIDPTNKTRCVAAGCSGQGRAWHAIYLSTDQAASWQHREIDTTYCGRDEHRPRQFAYDLSSFNGDHCTELYWSQIKDDAQAYKIQAGNSRLYRSTDGGLTWTQANRSSRYSGGGIATYPTAAKKRLYVTTRGENNTNGGLYVSTNGGISFAQVRSQGSFGSELRDVHTSPAEPDSIWVTTCTGIWKSTNEGATWTQIGSSALLSSKSFYFDHIAVSPVNANRILVRSYFQWFNCELHGTDDGGSTWWRTKGVTRPGTSGFDHSALFFNATNRAHMFAWSPAVEAEVLTFGPSVFCRSTDGGKIWYVFNDGYDGTILGGSSFTFNPHRPDEIFLGLTDKAGAYSLDGGTTWTPLDGTLKAAPVGASHHHSAIFVRRPDNTPVLACVNRAKGNEPNERQLKVSTDLGASWTLPLGSTLVSISAPSAFIDPGSEAIAFVCNYRTADYGSSWSAMNGCHAVFCGDASQLFGIQYRSARDWDVVRSTNKGVSWTVLTTLKQSNGEQSMAYDPVGNFVFFVAGGRLLRLNLANNQVTTLDTPVDERRDHIFGGEQVRQVAVDPVEPSWVYITRGQNGFNATPAVCRSRNSGETWDEPGPSFTGPLPHASESDGGQAAREIMVHPTTRHVWVSTRCAGMWKWRPPELL